MGIGNKLEILLNEKGMTAIELARRVNVSPSTIYSIIQRNNKKADIDVLIAIAKELGVPTEYFGDAPLDTSAPLLAAHFDGEELTEAEKKEVDDFIKFVKAKREKE